MDDDFALVRIVRIRNPESANPRIEVKSLAIDPRKGNQYDGDVQVIDTATGTDIKIALAGRLTDVQGKKFWFKNPAICVDDVTNGPPSTPCAAGYMPGNFKYTPSADNNAVTLHVPQLNNGEVKFKYRLFMQMSDNGKPPVDVTIDPRIINGGSASFVPTSTNKEFVGPGPMALIGAALLLVILGFALGWMLAGGERKPL